MRSRTSRAALLRHRWRAQGFAGPLANAPGEIVGRLGAVQAENYPLAKWSLAQRSVDLSEAAIDAAVADGTILRTHLLRPTWHFVLPRDIRWMHQLTATRVRAMTAAGTVSSSWTRACCPAAVGSSDVRWSRACI